MKVEIVVMPVADVDRAKNFYKALVDEQTGHQAAPEAGA
jgi:predicted enzyme related to lactoylglutathione lyase